MAVRSTNTMKELLEAVLQTLASGLTMPDADLEFITSLMAQIQAKAREPFDKSGMTPGGGSPTAGGQPAMSPAELIGGSGPPMMPTPGGMPGPGAQAPPGAPPSPIPGVMPRQAPNPDELRRIMQAR
mgnify:CR=1 FL=1